MATLAVAAILLTVGVPNFMRFVQNNRATTHTNELVTALNLARSEATQRGTLVTVCSSTDGATCSGSGDWTPGWIVLGPDGELVRAWPERSGGTNLITSDGDVQFEPRGSIADDGGADFAIRVPDCTGDQGRDVSVNRAGRVSVERVAC